MVRRIQCEADILVYAAALRPVFLRAADHGALQHKGLLFRSGTGAYHGGVITEVTHLIPLVLRESDNGNAALIAGGVTTVAIKRPCSFRFVDASVRIVCQHSM